MSPDLPTPDQSPREPLIPISALFHDDAGPHVVRRGAVPARSSGTHANEALSGHDLSSLLGAGIAGLGGMDAPPQVEEELVPIESLLFRGPAALAQAIAVSERLATHGLLPDQESFREIRDLLQLATTE